MIVADFMKKKNDAAFPVQPRRVITNFTHGVDVPFQGGVRRFREGILPKVRNANDMLPNVEHHRIS
jgi:hypothetical protein